mmetsp:Transcript_2716/g.6567  ORF Transcript_2716/g.6567 Transcript_2716/m.6567 type:complete len:226 (-) Transcript_2716:513-1190(-)
MAFGAIPLARLSASTTLTASAILLSSTPSDLASSTASRRASVFLRASASEIRSKTAALGSSCSRIRRAQSKTPGSTLSCCPSLIRCSNLGPFRSEIAFCRASSQSTALALFMRVSAAPAFLASLSHACTWATSLPYTATSRRAMDALEEFSFRSRSGSLCSAWLMISDNESPKPFSLHRLIAARSSFAELPLAASMMSALQTFFQPCRVLSGSCKEGSRREIWPR